MGVQAGILGRDAFETTISVPKLIAQIEHPAAVLMRVNLVLLVEVRYIRQLRGDAQFTVCLQDCIAFQRSKVLRERDLLVLAKRRPFEHQDCVLVHRSLDGRKRFWSERLR